MDGPHFQREGIANLSVDPAGDDNANQYEAQQGQMRLRMARGA